MTEPAKTSASLFDRVVMGTAFGIGLVVNVVTSAAAFFWLWWYLYETFGFLVGGLFGWVPAGVAALIIYLLGIVLSPLVGFGALCGVGYVAYKLFFPASA